MKTKRAIFFGVLCVCVIGMVWTMTANAANWECLQSNMGCTFARLKVPSGWIVKINHTPYGVALTFVPDEKHEWKI